MRRGVLITSGMCAVVFGCLLDGFELVDQIQNVPVDRGSKPYKPVKIEDCGVL